MLNPERQKELDKGKSVRRMFDAIADRYDLMNRVMTLGCDQKWRKVVVAKADNDGNKSRILDLATGTGDIAALLRKNNSNGTIVGGDFSQNMLVAAKRRFAGLNIHWQACDANQLPFADNSFQAVTFGYLLRNVDDVEGVLKEIHRVLMPGGRVISLDTTPPVKNLFYPCIQCYLRFGVPLLGKIFAGDTAAYSYLTDSTLTFYDTESLAKIFRKVGFSEVAYTKYMCGTIAIHSGIKQEVSNEHNP